MTDTEQKRINAICKVAHVDDISDLSDGYHTFRQLYYQRMMLFAAIVKQNRDKAWKSLRHADGELCFGGGWFIVGIDTPEGSYTYHYEDTYFGLFDCEELERGKTWDGHTEEDVTRLLSLEQEPCGDYVSRESIIGIVNHQRFGMSKLAFGIITEKVKELPSVTAQPKMGRWKRINKEKYVQHAMSYYRCSECGKEIIGTHNYCPNCGCKMQEVPE